MASRAIAQVAFITIAGAALAALPAAAQVGPFALGVKAGTLGIGAEAEAHLAGPLSVRLNYTSYSLKKTLTPDNPGDATFAITAKLTGAALIADLHPTKGAFRISAGMFFKTPTATGVATNNGSMGIGDGANKHDYASAQVPRLDATGGGKSTAPYVGLGFDKSVFTKGRVAFGFEIGGVFWGSPKPTITPTTTLTGSAKTQLDTDVAALVTRIQSKIDSLPTGLKIFPVLSLSLKVRM